MKKLLAVTIISMSVSGCSLLVPSKSGPSQAQYSMASSTCIQAHHPSTTLYGQCVEQQLLPAIQETKNRERLKGILIGLEGYFWVTFAWMIADGSALEAALAGAEAGAQVANQ